MGYYNKYLWRSNWNFLIIMPYCAKHTTEDWSKFQNGSQCWIRHRQVYSNWVHDMTQVLYHSRKHVTCTLKICSEKFKYCNFLLIKFSNLWKKWAKNLHFLLVMYPNCMRGTGKYNAFSESFWLGLSRFAQILHLN